MVGFLFSDIILVKKTHGSVSVVYGINKLLQQLHIFSEFLEKNDTDSEAGAVHQARVMFRACKDIGM